MRVRFRVCLHVSEGVPVYKGVCMSESVREKECDRGLTDLVSCLHACVFALECLLAISCVYARVSMSVCVFCESECPCVQVKSV